MAERIKRADVAQFLRQYKGGEFDRVNHTYPRKNKEVLAQAASSIEVGDFVKITGIVSDSELDPENFVQYYLNNGFLFKGVKYNSDSFGINDVVATADEPISTEGVGTVSLSGLYFGRYNHSGNETLSRVSFGTSGKFKYDPLGDYIVIDKSSKDSESNGYVFVFYDPLIGPFVGTYYSGTHTGCSEAGNHVHVEGFFENVVKSVTVPLGDIESGTEVLIMKRRTFNGGWIVTEAACPSE